MEANEFLGMSKKRAQDVAESKNMIFRLISIDGDPFMSYPEDQRTDRVCVEIVSGKVIKAVIQ
jgi:hypothetical protein